MLTTRLPILVNGLILLTAIFLFLLWPAGFTLSVMHSGVLEREEIPPFAFDLHASVTEEMGAWARERVASGRAKSLSTEDIAGTEWPIFSAVFYLWATESLQRQAVEQQLSENEQPRFYAADTIRAVTELIADPGHASWVIKHWGDDYLRRENLFYRMLLISGLTSYEKLTGDSRYTQFLNEQATSLATELDESPFGLLDDYPGQCYPIDILAAIAAIQRADAVLGTDHSAEVARAVRGFRGNRLDATTGLPAYAADSRTGDGRGFARGVGIAFMTIWAAETWPQQAGNWYPLFERHFWQQGRWISGFREYPKHVLRNDFLFDVDAGPVIGGIGSTATVFGIGAARSLARFDHAYTLGIETVAGSLPMFNDRWLVPWLVSNLTDAPFTGESILLFSFTRRPLSGARSTVGERHTPGFVYLVIALCGLFSLLLAVVIVRRTLSKLRSTAVYPDAWLQFGVWIGMLVAGLVLMDFSYPLSGALAILVATSFPAGADTR